MARREYPVEIGYHSGSSTGTLYYSRRGFTTRRSETPSDTKFPARVIQPAMLRRDIFGPGTTLGRTTAQYGDLILANKDGALDALFDYAFDGRTMTQYVGTPGSAYPSGYTALFTSTMYEPETTRDYVRIRLRDRIAELDKPIQTTVYAGTGNLEGGVDLKGKSRPKLYGYRRHIRAVLVDPTRLIYQVTSVGTMSISSGEVYEGGNAIPADGTPTYSDETDLTTNAPSSGTYRYLAAGGYLRLGSSPSGLITCNASAGSTTAGSIWAALMTEAGITNVDSTVAATLNADGAAGGTVGIWIGTDPMTYAEVMDKLMNTIGTWWGARADGELTAKRLKDPSTQTTTFDFTEERMRGLDRVSVRDEFGGVPCWRLRMRWNNKEPFADADIYGAATAAERAVLYRSSYEVPGGEDTTIRDAHPLAPDIILDSLYEDTSTSPTTEAERQFALRSVKRDRFEFRAPMATDTLAVDLGDYVQLTHSRFGLSGGKNFAVISIAPDPKAGMITFGVWG